MNALTLLLLVSAHAAPCEFREAHIAATIRDSGRPGPVVLVTGGIHGDEPAGYLAAEKIATWMPSRGKIVILPRSNEAAIAEKSRRSPTGEHRDLNRNFPSRDGETPRCDLALEIWRFVSHLRPDWVLDLHEGVDYRTRTKRSVGNSLIIYPNEETERVARTLLEQINKTIPLESRHFVLLRYPKKGSLARACAERLGARSLILETTRKGPTNERVAQHLLLVRTALRELSMLPTGKVSRERAG